MSTVGKQEHFITLFEFAPISLWEEDYSRIQRLLDEIRQQGVRSLEAYIDEHADFVDACMRQMTVRKVNQRTLEMLKAASQDELFANLGRVFRDGMRHHFRNELLAMDGELSWSGEGINYTLEGEAIDILFHWRILPGAEHTWDQVLVTIENITACGICSMHHPFLCRRKIIAPSKPTSRACAPTV